MESPDEAGRRVGDGVDGIELGDEAGDFRIIDRSNEAADVDLREVEGHGGRILRGNHADDKEESLEMEFALRSFGHPRRMPSG